MKKSVRKRNNQTRTDDRVVKTKFGTIIQDLSGEQKKVLSGLLFSATEASEHSRQIPTNDIKTDHLLVKGINLTKNAYTGNWEVGMIITNHGNFGTGDEQTSRINQNLIRNLVGYLKSVFEEDITEYIKKETK